MRELLDLSSVTDPVGPAGKGDQFDEDQGGPRNIRRLRERPAGCDVWLGSLKTLGGVARQRYRLQDVMACSRRLAAR